jgi:hypothetical protein
MRRSWKKFVKAYVRRIVVRIGGVLNSFGIVFKFEYVIWQCYLDQSTLIPDTSSPRKLNFYGVD